MPRASASSVVSSGSSRTGCTSTASSPASTAVAISVAASSAQQLMPTTAGVIRTAPPSTVKRASCGSASPSEPTESCSTVVMRSSSHVSSMPSVPTVDPIQLRCSATPKVAVLPATVAAKG